MDGMLGTRTRGGRMVGADNSTELWRHILHLWSQLSDESSQINKRRLATEDNSTKDGSP